MKVLTQIDLMKTKQRMLEEVNLDLTPKNQIVMTEKIVTTTTIEVMTEVMTEVMIVEEVTEEMIVEGVIEEEDMMIEGNKRMMKITQKFI